MGKYRFFLSHASWTFPVFFLIAFLVLTAGVRPFLFSSSAGSTSSSTFNVLSGLNSLLTRFVRGRNSHLSLNGVEETPPSPAAVTGAGSRVNGNSASINSPNKSGLDPNALFVNLNGKNVGFKHWHPMPVTPHADKLAGRSDMGGLWEWTSTVLEGHDGFKPMELYPGYTGKFMHCPRLRCSPFGPPSFASLLRRVPTVSSKPSC